MKSYKKNLVKAVFKSFMGGTMGKMQMLLKLSVKLNTVNLECSLFGSTLK